MDLHSGCAWKGQCRLFHFLWKAGYNRAILLSCTQQKHRLLFMLCRVQPHYSQQMESPWCSRCSTHTSECSKWSRVTSSEVKMRLQLLQNLVLLKAPSWSILFFLSPTFLVQMHNISCAWAEESRVCQPTSSAAIILIHHYMWPVSLPSEQGQALLGDQSPEQCPKLQLSFGAGPHQPCAASESWFPHSHRRGIISGVKLLWFINGTELQMTIFFWFGWSWAPA